MSAHDTTGDGLHGGGGQAPGEPSEDELRAAYEAELSRITSTDMMAQAAVSLLNIGARRLAPSPPPGQPGAAPAGTAGAPPERDLEQARDAIDGAKALLEIIERRIPREVAPLRDALSQLQMAYAREVQLAGGGEATDAPGAGRPAAASQPASGGEPGAQPAGGGAGEAGGSKGPGPAESSGRLWVPGR